MAKRWMAKNVNAVPFQRDPVTPPHAEKCGGHRRAATAVYPNSAVFILLPANPLRLRVFA